MPQPETQRPAIPSRHPRAEVWQRVGEALGDPADALRAMHHLSFDAIFHLSSTAREALLAGKAAIADQILTEIQATADYCARHGNPGGQAGLDSLMDGLHAATRAAAAGAPAQKHSPDSSS